MIYKRKTIDRWDIMTNYGYGWECENSEYTLKNAACGSTARMCREMCGSKSIAKGLRKMRELQRRAKLPAQFRIVRKNGRLIVIAIEDTMK